MWGDTSWWFWLHFSNNLMCLVIQSCPTLCNPMDCNPPGCSIRGILQARILEWVAMPFSRGSSWSRGWNWVSCIAGRFFTNGATRKAQYFKAWFLENREHHLSYMGTEWQNWAMLWFAKHMSDHHNRKETLPPPPTPVAQWLGLHLPMQRVQVWTLVGELVSHIPPCPKTET